MTKKKVLIADDDIAILDAMQLIMEDAGYEVKTVDDGKTVREMKDDLPDILFLDIWMSGMDGADICKHLKSQACTKHMPIILCSANRDTRKLAEECGADDFIAKPFDMLDLISKVEKHTN